jgi:hypothetical protein
VKEALQRETVAYDERLATNLVCHDLGVPQPPKVSSLVAHITLILDHMQELERGTVSVLEPGVSRTEQVNDAARRSLQWCAGWTQDVY